MGHGGLSGFRHPPVTTLKSLKWLQYADSLEMTMTQDFLQIALSIVDNNSGICTLHWADVLPSPCHRNSRPCKCPVICAERLKSFRACRQAALLTAACYLPYHQVDDDDED